MMRLLIICSIFVFAVCLSACGMDAKPIEDPNIVDFEVLYVGDTFTVLVRTEIDPDTPYERAAHSFGYGDSSCHVGGYEVSNYMFLYKTNYYDIVEFNKFRIVNCDDLKEIGIKGEFDN